MGGSSNTWFDAAANTHAPMLCPRISCTLIAIRRFLFAFEIQVELYNAILRKT